MRLVDGEDQLTGVFGETDAAGVLVYLVHNAEDFGVALQDAGDEDIQLAGVLGDANLGARLSKPRQAGVDGVTGHNCGEGDVGRPQKNY